MGLGFRAQGLGFQFFSFELNSDYPRDPSLQILLTLGSTDRTTATCFSCFKSYRFLGFGVAASMAQGKGQGFWL